MGSQPGPPPRASLTVACRAHLAASSLLGSQCSREGQTQSGIHSPPPLLPWPGAGLPPGAGQRGPGIPLPCWQVQLAHQTPQTPPRGFSVCMQGLCQLVPKGGVGHSGGRRASKDFRDGGERGTREGNSGGKEQSRGRESRAGRRETAEPPGPARSCPWGDGLGGVAQGHLCRCSPGTHCEVPSVPRTVVASWVQKKRRAALTQARPAERQLGPSPGREGETSGMGRGPRGAWAGLPGRPEGSRARTTGPAKRPRLGPRGEGPGAYPGVDGRRGLCTPSGLTQCSPSATHRQGGQQPGHCEAEPVPRASGEGASSPCARPCRCHQARLLHPVNPKQRRGPDSPAPASRVVLEFFWAVEALWDADSGSGGIEGLGGQGLTWQSLLSNRLMIGLLWVCPDLAWVRRGLGTGRHPRPPPRTGRLTHSRQQTGPRGPSRRPGLASLLKGVVRVPPGALRMEAAPVFRSRGAGGLRVHRK